MSSGMTINICSLWVYSIHKRNNRGTTKYPSPGLWAGKDSSTRGYIVPVDRLLEISRCFFDRLLCR